MPLVFSSERISQEVAEISICLEKPFAMIDTRGYIHQLRRVEIIELSVEDTSEEVGVLQSGAVHLA